MPNYIKNLYHFVFKVKLLDLIIYLIKKLSIFFKVWGWSWGRLKFRSVWLMYWGILEKMETGGRGDRGLIFNCF